MSSDEGLICYYGTFEHPKGEVYPKVVEMRPMVTDDGIRWASLFRMEVAGDLLEIPGTPLDPPEITNRINELEMEYLDDYKDFGFKLSDGSPTPHEFTSDDAFNLSGNQVKYRSWQNVLPTEYANTRSFEIHIEALFRQSYSGIVYQRETTTQIGTGGPKWQINYLYNGAPYRQTVAASTTVRYITQGTRIALDTWPAPLSPLWPADEQEWRRVVRQTSPRYHGDLSYTKGTHYQTDYTYYFERTSP